MVLFLLSKALYPGPARSYNKSLLILSKCAGYMLQERFERFQQLILTECPPPSKSHGRAQGGQFACTTQLRKRENMEKYNKASKHTNV